MRQKLEAQAKQYADAFASNPESQVFAPLAETYRKLRRFDEALQICRQGLQSHPDHLTGRALLGHILLEQGHLADAETELRKVTEQAPQNVFALQIMAKLHMTAGSSQKAVTVARQILALQPGDVLAQNVINQVENGSSTQSNQEPPQSVDSATLAELYLKQGHLQKALEVYESLPEREKHEDRIQHILRLIRGQRREKQKALLERLLDTIRRNRR